MDPLEAKVLVLDATMRPCDVVSGRKSIEHLFDGKAEVLEEYPDLLIRSTRITLSVPCVMRLFEAHGKRRYVKFGRHNVLRRDNGKCQYCGKKFPKEELTLDHILPKARRTPASWKSWLNIVTACYKCNQKKADRTPEEADMPLLRQPFKLQWMPDMVVPTA